MTNSKDKLQFSRFFRNSSKFHAPPVNMYMFKSMEIKQWEYEYFIFRFPWRIRISKGSALNYGNIFPEKL